ncbi:GNAT family N-acetyltransferase [Gemmatimonadota bacterium]
MPFDNQPTLVGELLSARPLQATDHSALYAVASDPLIWEQHPEPERYKPAIFGKFFDESLKSGGALIVRDSARRTVIGSSRYHGYDESLSEVEIGWTFFARSHWGGRYNGDLKRLMLEHAFQFVESVILYISPTNIRSQRAVQRVGGNREPARDQPGRFFYRIRPPRSRGAACWPGTV